MEVGPTLLYKCPEIFVYIHSVFTPVAGFAPTAPSLPIKP
jgi:hypothetical protein